MIFRRVFFHRELPAMNWTQILATLPFTWITHAVSVSKATNSGTRLKSPELYLKVLSKTWAVFKFSFCFSGWALVRSLVMVTISTSPLELFLPIFRSITLMRVLSVAVDLIASTAVWGKRRPRVPLDLIGTVLYLLSDCLFKLGLSSTSLLASSDLLQE